MKILMVSPYPPLRDGIGTYALQAVSALRADGHDVEVLSPGPSAAHHHLDLRGVRGAGALAKRVRSYDKVIVQFHPDFYFNLPMTPTDWSATAAAWAVCFRLAKSVEVVVHEVNYDVAEYSATLHSAMQRMWRAVDQISVHTDAERTKFLDAFDVPARRVHLVRHGEMFSRNTTHTQASARQSLGIDQGAYVFLSIGFIQPHKGFDRALTAFRALQSVEGERPLRLYVVGSLRVDDGQYEAHLAALQRLADELDGAEIVLGYTSDEMFDRWLVASDCLVLPYRNIWSSGVIERAALYSVPAIVSAVGGLADQVRDRDDVTLVATDAELVTAMSNQAFGRTSAADPAPRPWPDAGAADLRAAVQTEVSERATQRRGFALAHTSHSAGGAQVSAATAGSRAASVRAVPPIAMPAPASARPGVSLVKRGIRRATGWLLDPVYWQVNALRQATIDAFDAAERRE